MPHTDDLKKILLVVGSNLRDLRVAGNLSLETVAIRLKIPPGTLREIENGEYDWDIELIGSLCVYYNVTLDKLITQPHE